MQMLLSHSEHRQDTHSPRAGWRWLGWPPRASLGLHASPPSPPRPPSPPSPLRPPSPPPMPRRLVRRFNKGGRPGEGRRPCGGGCTLHFLHHSITPPLPCRSEEHTSELQSL